MEKQSWKKHVTLRLEDGFYMYRKVFSRDDKELLGAETNDILIKNHSVKSFNWNPNGVAKLSKKPQGHLESTMNNEPAVQLMTPDYPAQGPDNKTFASVPTPRSRLPLDVSTPKSLSELYKYRTKPNDKGGNNKKRQHPSPYLGPNAISLVKELIRDDRIAQKRRRRRERREKRKKKRRKVITRYPSIQIPSFPLPPLDQIRRKFAVTKEARLVRSNPKDGLIQLTNMIIKVQKDSITKVYRDDGPFAFIAVASVDTLDLFHKKMVVKSEDPAIAKFEYSSTTLPRELELLNALNCIRKRHKKVSSEIHTMVKLKELMASGRLEASVCEKVYPLPQPVLDTAKFAREQLIQNENLQRSHNTLSKIVMENLTIKLTERWVRFQEESKERQEQLTMSELYNREIASAGLPTVRSIVESLGAIS